MRLIEWLGSILDTDPRSGYPLFAAARVYAENPDSAKARLALEFVYREFLKSPNTRWRWLAHAALLAKHRLKDLPLARRYAAAIDRYTTDPRVPAWARQMEIFILEDMDELAAAKIMLGGLRITSYNVCYTKLLRRCRAARHGDHHRAGRIVDAGQLA